MKNFTSLAILLFIFSACTQKSHGPNIKRLRFRLAAETPTIDSTLSGDGTSRDIIVTLHDGLLRINEKNKLVPAFAESWQESPDHRLYTFKLRPNLKWSDGKALVAQDFVYAVERALNPATGAVSVNFLFPIENAQDFYSGKLKDFSKVGAKALDEKTFQVKLSASIPYWANIAAYPILYPLRKDIVEKYGDRWTEAKNYIGAGAYRLKEWTHNGTLLCEKNPNYWNQEALQGAFDEIEFRVVQEGNTAVTLYQKGDFDIIERVPFDQIPMLKSEPGLKVFPTLFVVGLGLGSDNPETKNPDVRRALSMAIDRSQFKKFDSTPVDSWVPLELPGSGSGRAYKYDPVEAKKIWNSLKDPPKKIEFYFPATAKAKITAEFIQQEIKKNLGLDVELNAQEWKVYIKSQATAHLPVFYQGWIADFPDAINFLDLFSCQSGQNYGHFCDKKYDELLNKSLTASTPERLKLYEEAEKILLQKDISVIPLTQENLDYLVNPKLTGFTVNGMGEFRLVNLRLTE